MSPLIPADIRHRQKLAELLVRVNRKEDAIAEYEAISRQYSNNHFYLKAIAVYKQIQKLDPANINTTLTLASLNEKQGLTGNALTEYTLAVNYYLKDGSLPRRSESSSRCWQPTPTISIPISNARKPISPPGFTIMHTGNLRDWPSFSGNAVMMRHSTGFAKG